MRVLLLLVLIQSTLSFLDCPLPIQLSGWSRDMALACRETMTDNLAFRGVCGVYWNLKTCETIHSRMRIYELESNETDVQTNIISLYQILPENVVMTRSIFLENISAGEVIDEFQREFITLYDKCRDTLKGIKGSRIYVTGFSQGLDLFVNAKLFHDLEIVPLLSYSFESTFIGDFDYTVTTQNPMKHYFDIKHVRLVDDTSEENYSENVYVDSDLICTLKRKANTSSDIENYLETLNGHTCYFT